MKFLNLICGIFLILNLCSGELLILEKLNGENIIIEIDPIRTREQDKVTQPPHFDFLQGNNSTTDTNSQENELEHPEISQTNPGSETTQPEIPQTNPESETIEPEIPQTNPGNETTQPEIPQTNPGIETTQPEIPQTNPGTETTNPETPETNPGNESTHPEIPQTTTTDLSNPSEITPEPAINCHEKCLQSINESIFSVDPDISYRMEGSSMKLSCEINTKPGTVFATITWLFENINPPLPECSLNSDETLNSCEKFDSIVDVDDIQENVTKSDVEIKNLRSWNSGVYICQIKVRCCPDTETEHIMSHQHRYQLIIESYYQIELISMGVLSITLLIIFVIGTLLIYRHRKKKYFMLIDNNVPIMNNHKVIHIPASNDFDDYYEDF